MKNFSRVFRAEPFRVLLFVAATVFFCWPFLPGERSVPYIAALKALFSLWASVIVVLFFISLSLGDKD